MAFLKRHNPAVYSIAERLKKNISKISSASSCSFKGYSFLNT